MFRRFVVLIVASCFLLWCYIQRAPAALPPDVPTVSAPDDSVDLSVWQQEAGSLKLITVESRPWFSRVKHFAEADIPPAWGWLTFVYGVFFHVWWFQPPELIQDFFVTVLR